MNKIKYDKSGHVKCKHREVIDTPFSKDFCTRLKNYCSYHKCKLWPGHKNKNWINQWIK